MKLQKVITLVSFALFLPALLSGCTGYPSVKKTSTAGNDSINRPPLINKTVMPLTSNGQYVDVVEKDVSYRPKEINMLISQNLRVSNQDPFFHKSRISKLDSSGAENEVVYPAKRDEVGSQFMFTFNDVGDYKLRCMIHDGMTTIIHVKP